MELDPTPAQLDALSADRPGEPVVMLNLVAYAAGADSKAAYVRYSKGFIPLLREVGGTVLWAGDVTGVAIGDEEADAWDYAVLVWYPNRDSFVRTMTNPQYAVISEDRHAGLAKHVILPVGETYSKFTPPA